MVTRVLIQGAAGRDFHNYLTYYKNNKNYKVVCFTATQIPGIEKRSFPAKLAKGKSIPIWPEKDLVKIIKKHKIDEVVFSYSDISYAFLAKVKKKVENAGAHFVLLDPFITMLKSKKKLIAITAMRTGCGKSQTTRKIASYLLKQKKKVVVIRHPMPYGDLVKQEVQRFAKLKDLDKHNCTIEEREEYEQHINNGVIVYAGVDYKKILKKAEKEADYILWDGGNNDTPFYKPDLWITVADPLRSKNVKTYYPGKLNIELSDIILINKENAATKTQINSIVKQVKQLNKKAKIIHADSIVIPEDKSLIKNKKVLIVEDGPTLTHGGMKYGAGYFAAKNLAKTIVNPKKYAVGSIKNVYKKYKLGKVLPAMGYDKKQMKELEKTINAIPCDTVVIATPFNLSALIKINKPVVRVKYELKEKGNGLKNVLRRI
jgi:predicted GTPase